MKHFITFLLLSASVCNLTSCSNEEVVTPQHSYNEDGIEFINNGSVLQFKDLSAYQDAFQKIGAMNGQERQSFLSELPFKTQVVIMAEADEELLEICENSQDKETFDALYAKFKQKYEKIFMFSDDTTDLSPYSKLTQPIDELFVNEKGQFMIGDSLVNSKKYTNFTECQQQSVALTRSATDLSSVNDASSRQSDRKVGMRLFLTQYPGDIAYNYVNANLTSQKKTWVGWVRYSTIYRANIHFVGANYQKTTSDANRWQNADGLYYSIETVELSGNVNMVLGRKASYSTMTGDFEVWSRGVPYESRGRASVNLINYNL